MDSNESSPYQPLEQSKRRFRLLRFLQSDGNRTRCEMKSFSLLSDGLPPWKALSYRWGEDEPDFMVYLNDHPVPVRKGLQTFLIQATAEKQRDWYFIDALCIDQDNDSEKACQVQQMGEIYRRAEEVVVWIVYEPYHVEGDEDHGYQTVYESDTDTHDVSSLSSAQVKDAILENSYWSRLWILQEVLLAKRLTFRIGSAGPELLNPIPEETIFDRRELPNKKDEFDFWQFGFAPTVNKNAALNILYYRYFKTQSLRAGKRLPFHKAVDSFARQRCGRPHDKVFAYLGLTNSRIQIDYSTPILDLFVATLADCLLSAGFITGHVTRLRVFRGLFGLRNNHLVAPLLAFGLSPCEPVVQLLIREVTKFFAPGFGGGYAKFATLIWWVLDYVQVRIQDIEILFNREHEFELEYIGSTCAKFFKSMASGTRAGLAMQKEIAERLKALEKEDAVMSAPGESGESKTYSQWAAHARTISEQIWQRFIESGEDAEGEMDHESWTLIA